MFSKKRLLLMAFQFPVAFLLGVLFTFAYSLQAHDLPAVHWPIAVGLGVIFDVAFTWMQTRRDHEQDKEKP